MIVHKKEESIPIKYLVTAERRGHYTQASRIRTPWWSRWLISLRSRDARALSREHPMSGCEPLRIAHLASAKIGHLPDLVARCMWYAEGSSF